MESKSIIYVIDGNIGSGKSELIKNLKEKLKIEGKNLIFLKEPVDDWATIKDKNGKTMLEMYYEDQERWSFSFQMMAFISRLTLLQDTVRENPNSIIIMERNMHTDRHVFAKMLFDIGKIHECDMEIYTRWFDNFADPYKSHKIIYVKTDPVICAERIVQRGRMGENIELEFLVTCDKYHDEMVSLYEDDKIIRIDGNHDCYETDILNSWIEIIHNELSTVEIQKSKND